VYGFLQVIKMSQVFSDEAVSRAMEEIKSNPSSRRHGADHSHPLMHKVSSPPKQTLFQDFKHNFNETFFSDDPFAKFKDQTKKRKFVLGLQSVFPILEWGRGYNLKSFKGDLIAGLTIASLCIPQVDLFVQMSRKNNIMTRR
jgi:sulfate transporter 1, high-affinity